MCVLLDVYKKEVMCLYYNIKKLIYVVEIVFLYFINKIFFMIVNFLNCKVFNLLKVSLFFDRLRNDKVFGDSFSYRKIFLKIKILYI